MPHNEGERAPALPENVNVWLTERDAAKHVQYSSEHLRRLRREGGGPPFAQRVAGGKVRYRRSDLDAWLDAQGPREARRAAARAARAEASE